MSDENIEVTEIESPFLQRTGEKLYSYKFPTKASIVSMSDGTSVEAALSSVQETLGETTAEELAEAVADAHTHENKEDVLDLLGVDEDGTLTFDGDPVGSGDGSGETSTRPWTAYGDGVDEAPEKLRDSGIYVSDEAEAPEEKTQSAVLRQKRDEDLVPIYPRTDADLVSVAVDGIESTNVAGALTEQQQQVEELQTAVQAIEETLSSVATGFVELEEDVPDGEEVETAGVGYKPGTAALSVYYEGIKCILGRQYEEGTAAADGYATSIKILFDADSGATFEFSALNGVTR